LQAAFAASPCPSPTGQICTAATQLEDARLVTTKAILADQLGEHSISQTLAHEAHASAERGRSELQSITSDEVLRGPIWQALSLAYLHVGQAANALLPAYENTYGMSPSELATADTQFAIAKAGLPEDCFVAGLNRPDSSGP
jgi:hypothetical protein